jgi:hypothetical protein
VTVPNAFEVTGTLTDERTLKLDEALPFGPSKVRVIVEQIPATAPVSYQEAITAIRERQKQRGHRSPTRAEVDAALETERKSWDH